MKALARESNFHRVCKLYLKRGALSPFFDAPSLIAAGIVSKTIIFFPEYRTSVNRNVPLVQSKHAESGCSPANC